MEACDGMAGIGGVALSKEDFMRHSLLAAVSVSPLLFFSFAGSGGAQAPQPNQLSEPLVHENLAIYFIRGPSVPGKVPLTLEEAMAAGTVRVRETGNVNQLEIENIGDSEVAIRRHRQRRQARPHPDGQSAAAAQIGRRA